MTKILDRLLIGASNGVVYNASLANLMEPKELPMPPSLGEGAVEPPERIEYPDARVIKTSGEKLAVLFNDKTLVFYNFDGSYDFEIDKVLKGHASAVYDIDCYPSSGDPLKF